MRKEETVSYSPCQVFFYKGPDKYFRFCRPYSVCCNYSFLHCGAKAALDNKYINKWVWPNVSEIIEKYRWQVDLIWPTGHSLPTSGLCKTYKNCIAKDLFVCALREVFNGPKCYYLFSITH